MTIDSRDALLKRAIVVPDEVTAPADLGDAILAAIAATPQRRPGPAAWLDLRWPAQRAAFLGAALLALLIAAAILVALAQPSRSHRLAMYHGGPDRTGVMPGPGPGANPAILWDVPRPGAMPFTTMPLVADGRVFVADDSGTVAALDGATGKTIWETDVGSRIHGTPALDGDLIVAGTDAGDIVALRAADGAKAWGAGVGGAAISASLLVDDGLVYAGGEDRSLHVLDGATGRELWSIDVGGPVTRGPALASGVLYVGAAGGQFSAIDITTHAIRWMEQLGPGGVGTPAIGGGLVFVGRGLLAANPPHDLVALDAATGQQRWHFATADGLQVHAGGLAGGVMYAVSDDGSLFALDASTGATRWTATTDGILGTLASIVDGVLYVGSADRTVRAFDAGSGQQIWQLSVTGIPTQQAIVDGRLYLGTSLGRAVAIGDRSAASGMPTAAATP
jgi:outer membrane protein assembly factor BamB